MQVVFFWTLLVRQITRFYHANPTLRAQQIPAAVALHDSLAGGLDLVPVDLSPEETAQIKEIFDLFDTNGGGSIDQEELDAAMFALGFHRNYGNKDQTKLEIQNNAVTLEDFILIMKGEKSGTCQNEDVWLSFSVLSQSALGRRGDNVRDILGSFSFSSSRAAVVRKDKACIDLDDLKQACHEFELRLTEEELVYMMSEADYDKSGSVDIHKFMRIMQRTPWF